MPTEIALGFLAAASAILGAVMSLHPPTRRKAKQWYLVGFVVLGVAGVCLAMIQWREGRENATRAERTQASFATNLADLKASTVALRRSEEEARRLQGLNTRLQYQLLAQSKDIAHLSTTTLNNLTGKDSYAYVVPQDHAASADGIPLAIKNAGPHILYGISIRIMRTTTEADLSADAFDAPEIPVATLYPGEIRILPARRILPQFNDGNTTDDYWLHISAQNGLISQSLSFRPRREGLPWAYSMRVTRVEFRKDGRGRVTSATLPLFIRGWTDEIPFSKK